MTKRILLLLMLSMVSTFFSWTLVNQFLFAVSIGHFLIVETLIIIVYQLYNFTIVKVLGPANPTQ